jgi:hypothetical protein
LRASLSLRRVSGVEGVRAFTISSVRAALIYQHKTQDADRKIADPLEALIEPP